MNFSLKQKFNLILKKRNFKKLICNTKILSAGRNITGKITVRHRGGSVKKSYRIVDYYRSLLNIKAVIYTFEYDPFRNTLLSLIIYTIGVFSYILSMENTVVGFIVYSTYKEKLKTGCSTLVSKLKINTKISCVELGLFSGAKLSRSSGTFAKIAKKTNVSVVIKLKSNKLQKISK
jgi:large subunit ribosomal protein L2